MTHEDTVAKLKEVTTLLRQVGNAACFFEGENELTPWKRGRATAYVDSAYWAAISAINFLELGADKP